MSKEARGKTAGRVADELQALRAENTALRGRCSGLEAALEVVTDAAFVKDARGRYLVINSAGARLLGKSVEEVVGKDDTELFAPDTARRIIEVDRVVLTEGSTTTDDEIVTAAGVSRSMRTALGSYLDGDGRVIGVVGVARDITGCNSLQAERDQLLERRRLQVDRLPMGYILHDADCRVLDWNPAAEKLFGYTKDEASGRVALDLIVPQPVRDDLKEIVRRISVGDMNAHSVNENRTKDGRIITCEWFNTPLVEADGRVTGSISLVQDITRRKRTEEALEESKQRFRAVFENSLDAILLMDDSGGYVDVNPAACRLLGYTREEFLRLTVRDITPGQDSERIPELMGQFLSAGTLSGEYTLLCKGGATRVAEYCSVANILPGLHLAVHRDITDRKLSDQELRESEERVRLLLESTGEAIFGIDMEGRCTFCNPASLRLLGFADARDLLGNDMHRLIHHSRADGTPCSPEDCPIYRALSHGEEAHVEDEILWRSDGTCFPAEYASYPLRRGEETVGSVITFIDITDRRRSEGELRTLNAALENAVEGIARVDPQGRYLATNRAYADMLGYLPEELVGKDWWQTVHPDDLEEAKEAYRRMESEGKAEVETRGVRKDYSVFWKQVVIIKTEIEKWHQRGHYCFSKDITARKRAEQDLRDYAERLEVVSRRVVDVQEEERRHIARELHDEIGQILSVIGVNLHAARGVCDAAAWPRLDECLDIVDRAVRQVHGLALDLRPSMLDDLGLAAAMRWLVDRQTRPAGLVAHFVVKSSGAALAPDLATACFRVAQEALTNVVRHARARQVWVELRQGDTEVELVIRDDGVGFDPAEARLRAVRSESFGLLGVQERVGLLRGRVAIESAPGHGTTLFIRLPVTSAPHSDDTRREGGRR